MELRGESKGGRPQRKFVDVMKEDKQRAGVTEKTAIDREADDLLW